MARGQSAHAGPTAEVSTVAPARPTEDQIRCRAYEKFCNRNGAPGDPITDWFQAERELIEERTGPVRRPQGIFSQDQTQQG
jgi:hypothetical protein